MAEFCWNESCSNLATKQCSVCKTAAYCGAKCQKSHWKVEHKTHCPKHKQAYDINLLLAARDREARQQGPPKPRDTHCTGCNSKWDEDEGLYCDQTCPDCGYSTCESCSCSNNRGSCYCEDKNFGHFYCDRVPKYYHVSSHTGRRYTGDRHPDASYDINPKDDPELFEEKPRKCRTCGEVKLCMKEEYLRECF
ncbi:hypothetical protein BKA70DRAFT_1297015 [Coprinopsis sp. MPI-PUGE-AT-0042]|nr:hypothetical protein BKA70DRAFT_1297015 [Coprinopsis sp. MPI-PUGE-AT-0042]